MTRMNGHDLSAERGKGNGRTSPMPPDWALGAEFAPGENGAFSPQLEGRTPENEENDLTGEPAFELLDDPRAEALALLHETNKTAPTNHSTRQRNLMNRPNKSTTRRLSNCKSRFSRWW